VVGLCGHFSGISRARWSNSLVPLFIGGWCRQRDSRRLLIGAVWDVLISCPSIDYSEVLDGSLCPEVDT